LRHTKVKLDPKTRDLYALIVCVGMIEGPKLIAFVMRNNAAKAAKQEAQARDQSQQSHIIVNVPNNPSGVYQPGAWPVAGSA